MSAIYILWLRELKRYTRSRAQIVASLGNPLLYLLVLGFGLGPVFKRAGNGDYLQFVAPGVIGMTVLFSSIFSGLGLLWDRQFGFLKETLVAPVSRALASTYDLIIKSGRVIDPSAGLDAVCDVAISGGRIAAVAANIAADSPSLGSSGITISFNAGACDASDALDSSAPCAPSVVAPANDTAIDAVGSACAIPRIRVTARRAISRPIRGCGIGASSAMGSVAARRSMPGAGFRSGCSWGGAAGQW